MYKKQANMVKKVFKIRLKVGDNVIIRTGQYRGKSGKVTAVHPTLNAVTVEGINVVKRHVKPNKAHPQGGMIEITKPIAVSKIGISDNDKPSRIGIRIDAKGNKTRFTKKTNKEIK